jgi:hypothetical protein
MIMKDNKLKHKNKTRMMNPNGGYKRQQEEHKLDKHKEKYKFNKTKIDEEE